MSLSIRQEIQFKFCLNTTTTTTITTTTITINITPYNHHRQPKTTLTSIPSIPHTTLPRSPHHIDVRLYSVWESCFNKPFYIWITPATSTHTFTMECNSLSNQEQEKCVTWNTPPVHSPIRAQKCVSQSSNNTTLIVLPVNLTWRCRYHLQSPLTSWGDRDAVVPRTSKTAMINNISGSHEPTNQRTGDSTVFFVVEVFVTSRCTVAPPPTTRHPF